MKPHVTCGMSIAKRVDPLERSLKNEESVREILVQGSEDGENRASAVVVMVTQVRLSVHEAVCKAFSAQCSRARH
jgi:hypothetical protein